MKLSLAEQVREPLQDFQLKLAVRLVPVRSLEEIQMAALKMTPLGLHPMHQVKTHAMQLS